MPDLNTVPPSPRALAAPHARRRRSSQHTTPASVSLNILPSNQNVVVGSGNSSSSHGRTSSRGGGGGGYGGGEPHHQQLSSASNMTSPEGSAVGPGPGPLRHPRPLTASELHTQLEKEQEAVVNRLTRELSLLRAAHNASVVSNASSTSATPSHDAVTDSSLLSGAGFSIPTPRRHHRNSSATSQQHFPVQLASSYEARQQRPSVPLSRQDSAASRRSQTNSPAPHYHAGAAGFMDQPPGYFHHHHHHQRLPPPYSYSSSSAHVGSLAATTPGSATFPDHHHHHHHYQHQQHQHQQLSPGLMPATSRYEETAFYRNELEAAKKENDGLKRRIRELERMVQSRRAADRTRSPSDAASTAASASATAPVALSRDLVGGGQDRARGLASQSVASLSSLGVGVPEDEVRVGESAASAGLGNNNAQ
ncbi:hypothetical protein CP533_4452 [Ophiocordyceps camponoti-saundersi (nom. inval.)]|nr:hypothetical protein CP533_4452 [Ophiocordyceps camponoti-saundersi (nom. inval.)]